MVDGFVEGHFVVEGTITGASGEAVPGALIVLRSREDDCDNSDITSPRTVESDSSGNFLHTVILPLFTPQVCLVYRITPPQGTGLETVEREIPEVTVFPVSVPPDTVEILVTLEAL
ncbi:MAG TPA: hypothetical protein VJ982_09180 [Gemmatimonadota bacterium]|nr:hypothetical protein [Gemmatimonadota bacterium]